jgi:imidazole glycerol-phosphate synthase subunit HisF
MKRARIIPVMLLKNNGLYKTSGFKNEVYIGDPINAVKIFNDKLCDELVFLDIIASKQQKPIDFELIEKIATECFMPFSYGGGITELNHIERLLKSGIEKVVLNTILLKDPSFLARAAKEFGSSTIVASVDVKKDFFNNYQVFSHSKCKTKGIQLSSFLRQLENEGAGELMINSVDGDGKMNGYDLKLAKTVSEQLSIPVVFCGGGKNLDDIKTLLKSTHVSAAAAASMFVFKGPHRAVLISYPSAEEINEI